MSDLEQQINEIKSSTILSSFNDKMTLLQWLKKLEQAIKESNINYLQSVVVNEIEDNKFSISFNFEQNTKTTNEFEVKVTTQDVYRYYAKLNVVLSGSETTSIDLSFVAGDLGNNPTSSELKEALPEGANLCFYRTLTDVIFYIDKDTANDNLTILTNHNGTIVTSLLSLSTASMTFVSRIKL